MKKFTITAYRTYKQEIDVVVRKELHDIPTWIFPESFGGRLKTPCPICNQEMRLNIAHGQSIETCSVIELSSGDVMPIHTECFNSIGDPDYKINHFNQSSGF